MKIQSIQTRSRPSLIRWNILAMLVAASFISYVLRTNLSFAAPGMMQDLGLNEVQWGWVLAAFTAGYALFQFPGGILGDRLGPRLVLSAIAGLWALLTVVTSLVPGPEASSTGVIIGLLLVVRFLVGAVHAPVFPVVNTSILRWFPVGGWGLPLGLTSTGLTLGGAAAAVALPLVIAGFGWRNAFLWIAPLGVLIALIWWRYSRDEPACHPGVNAAEVKLIGRGRATERSLASLLPPLAEGGFTRRHQTGARPLWYRSRCSTYPTGAGGSPATPPGEETDGEGGATWLDVLKNRDILFLTLSYSSMNFVFYIVFNWFFYYLVEVREFSATDAGFVASAQWIAGAAGAALGGWLCDRLCTSLGLRWGCRWPIIIGMAASAVLLLVGAFHPTALVALSAMVLLFFFNQLNEGPYWAASVAVGGRHAGAAGGVMNTGANVMGIFNALLVPFFSHTFGWTFAIASGAIFAVLGIAFMLLVRADCPIGGGA